MTFKKILVAALTALTLFLPNLAVAANTNGPAGTTCDELRKQFQNVGQGGVIKDVPEFCSVEAVYQKFINIALFAVGIVAVIAIIYGGYLYMTAGGNDVQKKSGKNVLTWAIIGLVVVIMAAVIVNVVVSSLVENRFV